MSGSKISAISSYENSDDSRYSSSSGRSALSRYTIFFLCCTAIFTGYLFGYFIGPLIDRYDHHSSSSKSKSSSTSISSISSSYNFEETPIIKFYNNYTATTPMTNDYPWDYIVEPYRVTYFYIDNPIPASYTTDIKSANGITKALYSYNWYINGWHKDLGENAAITFTDSPGSKVTVEVELKYVDNNDRSEMKIVARASMTVIVKYVRREIRSLYDRDREALFNAVSTMQYVPTQIGKKLYGKNYYSKDYFNRIHLYYGGSKSCDHWHQGPGFVTSHIAFEIMYERSIQSINPSVTLPYWDFTLESTFYTPSSFRSSGVFTDDWFGDARCNSTQHTPTTGRFNYVSTMMNADNFSSLYNSYHMLRSPWNIDPTPFMTRSDNIYGITNNLKPSGCTEYHKSMTYKDWKNLAKQLNSNAHGHIHELIGGSWNPQLQVDDPNNIKASTEAYQFLHATEAYSKILWRYDYLSCPSSCLSSQLDCKCTCRDFKSEGLTNAHILAVTNIMKGLVFYDKDGNAVTSWYDSSKQPYETLPTYTFDETQAIYDEIMNVLCNPGHIGDMFQATSTNDITFWVLHPTLDRLWQRMRLNEYYNLITYDSTWGDSEQTCDGHYSYSTTPFRNIFDNNDVVYTNAELYKLLDPTTNNFPYVYDHFRWSHCDFLGYDMKGL